MPRPLVLLLAPIALVAASCGGTSGNDAEPAPQAAPVTTVAGGGEDSLRARLADQPGANVGLILGTADFTVGENRVSFLVVNVQGQIVKATKARVFAARGSLDAAPTSVSAARLLPLDPDHGSAEATHAEPDAKALFVTRVRFDRPGRYWLLAEPEGRTIQAVGEVQVRAKSASPAVGSKAPASDTPTLGDAPLDALTTAVPPDRDLLRYSIGESIEAGIPFVAVFATPKFCSSRTCGPTVEIVQEARKHFAARKVRFIHVEVYKDNDPQKGINKWMHEWKLPSEPWIFVVDGKGIVRAKFEGSASVQELEAAVTEVLRTE